MQMYKYANLSRKGANNKGALQQFALKGYEHFKALPVPQPQSFWTAASSLKKQYKRVHPFGNCFGLSACFSSTHQ